MQFCWRTINPEVSKTADVSQRRISDPRQESRGVNRFSTRRFLIQVVECRLHDSNVGQVHTWRFLCVRLRAVGLLLLRGGGEGGGEAAAARHTGKNRLLGRSSASSVCCWPDQLARCLPGVWHVTTKGLGRTGDGADLINPPI